jgi:hypothetical protein
MPQFWIAVFFILLAVAELYQSVKSISLPFPAYLVLGTLLAVASNYQSKAAFSSVRSSPQAVKVADPSLSPSPLPIVPTTAIHQASAADRPKLGDRDSSGNRLRQVL